MKKFLEKTLTPYCALRKNRAAMLALLIKWHVNNELKLNNFLITKREAQKRAFNTWLSLKNSNLIDKNNLIKKGFRELYEEMTNA